MSFVSGLKPGRILPNFRKLSSNEKLGLISMTQKIDTIIDFFLINRIHSYTPNYLRINAIGELDLNTKLLGNRLNLRPFRSHDDAVELLGNHAVDGHLMGAERQFFSALGKGEKRDRWTGRERRTDS